MYTAGSKIFIDGSTQVTEPRPLQMCRQELLDQGCERVFVLLLLVFGGTFGFFVFFVIQRWNGGVNLGRFSTSSFSFGDHLAGANYASAAGSLTYSSSLLRRECSTGSG